MTDSLNLFGLDFIEVYNNTCKTSPVKRTELLKSKETVTYEDVESAILPIDDTSNCTKLELFNELHEIGNVPATVLYSIASIIGLRKYHIKKSKDNTTYEEYIHTIATFFLQGESKKKKKDDSAEEKNLIEVTTVAKLVCLEFLMNEFLPPFIMHNDSPISPTDNLQKTIARCEEEEGGEDIELIEDTLKYICGHDDFYTSWNGNKPVHCEIEIFENLRKECLYLRNMQERDRIIQKENEILRKRTVEKVVRSSDKTVHVITNTAMFVEKGLLQYYVPTINGTIDITGNIIKTISPSASKDGIRCHKCPINFVKKKKKRIKKTRRRNKTTMTKKNHHPIGAKDNDDGDDDAITAALLYANRAKYISEKVCMGTRYVSVGIRDASTFGIQQLINKFEKERIGEKIIPDKESRDVLCSVGKVGVASVGALAIVSDAIVESSVQIGSKSIEVTADVVEHCHSNDDIGETYGQIIRDVGSTTGNILKTASAVTTLQASSKISKAVVKNASKQAIIMNSNNENKDIADKNSNSNNSNDNGAVIEKQQSSDGRVYPLLKTTAAAVFSVPAMNLKSYGNTNDCKNESNN